MGPGSKNPRRCKHKFHRGGGEIFYWEETSVPPFNTRFRRQTYKRTNRRTAPLRKAPALWRGLIIAITQHKGPIAQTILVFRDYGVSNKS